MSDEAFLSRWSRRKQAAAVESHRANEEARPETAQVPAPAGPPPAAEPADRQQAKSEAAFDPATLPPLESITAVSDIRDFLRAGVPADLTRAALRRAWSADPAVRDFIGLAENSWDFTAPDSIPGFGPLNATPEEIRALVDRVMGQTREVVDAALEATQELPQNAANPAVQPEVRAAQARLPVTPDHAETHETDTPADCNPPVDTAAQYVAPEDAEAHKPRRPRTRGGALPR